MKVRRVMLAMIPHDVAKLCTYPFSLNSGINTAQFRTAKHLRTSKDDERVSRRELRLGTLGMALAVELSGYPLAP
jgi:hypothetical protein